MSLASLDRIAVGILGKALGSDGNALIDLDVVSYLSGFTDYDAGTVVNAEISANRCAGVDVYSGPAVSVFRHYSRNDRN